MYPYDILKKYLTLFSFALCILEFQTIKQYCCSLKKVAQSFKTFLSQKERIHYLRNAKVNKMLILRVIICH